MNFPDRRGAAFPQHAEDGQFCGHHGVDFRELNAVINDALDGEKPRGASTITMQTAKNLFLFNSRSLLRKAAEIPLAISLDSVLPKKRIMDIYQTCRNPDEIDTQFTQLRLELDEQISEAMVLTAGMLQSDEGGGAADATPESAKMKTMA